MADHLNQDDSHIKPHHYSYTSTSSISDHADKIFMYPTDMGRHDITLRPPWLQKNNPQIDWIARKVTFSTKEESGLNMPDRSIETINSAQPKPRTWYIPRTPNIV
jgi:hypothetical protein